MFSEENAASKHSVNGIGGGGGYDVILLISNDGTEGGGTGMGGMRGIYFIKEIREQRKCQKVYIHVFSYVCIVWSYVYLRHIGCFN